MAARDRYTSNIECLNCGQKGRLYMSEDDHPYMRNPHREVDKVEGEFIATVSEGVDVKVICSKCNTEFTY
jgi:hypothetical protein